MASHHGDSSARSASPLYTRSARHTRVQGASVCGRPVFRRAARRACTVICDATMKCISACALHVSRARLTSCVRGSVAHAWPTHALSATEHRAGPHRAPCPMRPGLARRSFPPSHVRDRAQRSQIRATTWCAAARVLAIGAARSNTAERNVDVRARSRRPSPDLGWNRATETARAETAAGRETAIWRRPGPRRDADVSASSGRGLARAGSTPALGSDRCAARVATRAERSACASAPVDIDLLPCRRT